MNGSEGRIDGGIGISLENPSLHIKCEESAKTSINYSSNIKLNNTTLYDSKILDTLSVMKEHLGIDTEYTFNIDEIYPIHQGLGLGTQLSLSVAKLVAEENDLSLDAFQLANIVHRGGTSGIGVHSFQKGGFIVDGGHKTDIKNEFLPSSAAHVSPPPLIARYDFPENWTIILVNPEEHNSVSGNKEINIFREYAPIKLSDVERISHLTLMKLMPAVLERDIDSFSDAVNKIQNIGFKKIERELQSKNILMLLNNMQELEIPCVGMSSFGPTCFGIMENCSKSIIKELKDVVGEKASVTVTKGKNRGSKVSR